MALKTIVKVGEVNNLSDARYCAGMGVEMIGFNLDDEGGIDANTFKGITGWIEGPKYIGEFTNDTPESIKQKVKEFDLPFIQVRDEQLLPALADISADIIFAVNPSSLQELENKLLNLKDQVSYILIESTQETLLNQAEIAQLQHLSEQYPLLLGYGFNDETVLTILDQIHPSGIALKGGDEVRPGYRNFDEMADILEALEVDD